MYKWAGAAKQCLRPVCLYTVRRVIMKQQRRRIVIWRLQIIQYNAANPIILLFMTFHSRHLLEVSSVFRTKIVTFA